MESMTGTSTRTPTTVASAAPDSGPNKTIAVATANSKKLLAPISAPGARHRVWHIEALHQHIGQRRIEIDLDKNGDGYEHHMPCLPGYIVGLEREEKHQHGEQRDGGDWDEPRKQSVLEPCLALLRNEPVPQCHAEDERNDDKR